ncbi:MAG: HAMP domain-containing sensor histidine kinase [Kiritimatiellia bacterium]
MELRSTFYGGKSGLRLEIILFAVIFSAAFLAGYILFVLKSDHQEKTHIEAVERVIDQGDQLLKALVTHTEYCCSTNPTPEEWRKFSSLVDRILAVRKDIQSISIRNGDLTVFHRQADGVLYPQQNAVRSELSDNKTIMSRETIDINGKQEPVFVFSRRTSGDPENKLVLETTFTRDAVTDKESIANQMIESLFNFSLTVLILSSVLSGMILVIALARDKKRQEISRQEEHLAFSGVMANGILHDFRNPMSAVRLDAQMLERETKRKDGMRQERVHELAERIARAMGRMDKIFAEFLYLAKPGNEKSGPLDLPSALDECIEILAPRIEQAELTVEKKFDREMAPVAAYAFAIKRAMLNVIINAIHFSPEKGRILISAHHKNSKAIIEICDEGPGIPEKKRKEVFKLFVSGRPEGTGLGLFLAKTAITRCGGKIEAVDSRNTTGAAIRITLPLYTAKQQNHLSGDR